MATLYSVIAALFSSINALRALTGLTESCARVDEVEVVLGTIMASLIIELSACDSGCDFRKGEGRGQERAGSFSASRSREESLVNSWTSRKRDDRVKIATRAPAGIVLRYLMVCWCTYCWSGICVFRESIRSTLMESAVFTPV